MTFNLSMSWKYVVCALLPTHVRNAPSWRRMEEYSTPFCLKHCSSLRRAISLMQQRFFSLFLFLYLATTPCSSAAQPTPRILSALYGYDGCIGGVNRFSTEEEYMQELKRFVRIICCLLLFWNECLSPEEIALLSRGQLGEQRWYALKTAFLALFRDYLDSGPFWSCYLIPTGDKCGFFLETQHWLFPTFHQARNWKQSCQDETKKKYDNQHKPGWKQCCPNVTKKI